LTKLRGAAQGVLPLIAEILVAELATALDLPVPERVLITIDDLTPSLDKNDELLDLLARSHGQKPGLSGTCRGPLICESINCLWSRPSSRPPFSGWTVW